MKNIAVLISGNGTNLQSIIDHIKTGKLKCNLAVVISNKEDAYGLKRAKRAKISAHFVDHKDISREEHEKRIIEILKKHKIHFVDEGVDTGPIILQKINPIKANDTLESFKKRGLKLEHQAFPEAIKLFCEDKLEIEGRIVKVKK